MQISNEPLYLLGTFYFIITVAMVAFGLAFMALPIVQTILGMPMITWGTEPYFLPVWGMILCLIGGFLVLTLALRLIRAIGKLHGKYAKRLLVS